MAAFFDQPRPDRPGLAVFLNAGDPPLPILRDVILLLDECRVDCLELAVPFPNSASDGPVIRRSADRALADGVERDGVLAFVKEIRPELVHLRIALLADWSHSIKGLQLPDFIGRVRDSRADGLLVHGLPPRLKTQYYAAAEEAGQPIVTTCYASSDAAILDEAAEHGSAYIYLVAHYGRSGTSVEPDHSALVPAMERLRSQTGVPIAVGFGVKNRGHIAGLGEVGADAAIVGSACVACVEDSLSTGHDVVADFRLLLEQLGETPAPQGA